MSWPIVDTRPLFRPLYADVVALARTLTPEDWNRATVAGRWKVRDVMAHLLDTSLRRLSFARDRMPTPPPDRPIDRPEDFVAFINELNATWVLASARLSPRVLTDLYATASSALADYVETVPLNDQALFPVSWAGEAESRAWLDIGREFTEIWHHGAQIRDAVGAGPFRDPSWLRAVLRLAVHVLPHAYRDAAGHPDPTVAITIDGPAGGSWALTRRDAAWILEEDTRAGASARVSMTDDTAWRLWFNGLSASAIGARVTIEGDRRLVEPLLAARSVIV